MVSKKFRVTDALGLHLRPAGKLCEKALQYQCSVTFQKGNYSGNVKSVISLLAGGVKRDQEITLICSGVDEEQALNDLSSFMLQELTVVEID